MIAGVSVLQTSVSISQSLRSQNWQHLADEAARAGVSYATSCLKKNGTNYWTNQLKPSTNCAGSTNGGSNYISDQAASGDSPHWRSSFTVSVPDGSNHAIAKGIVELVDASDTVTKTWISDKVVVINVAGGGLTASKVVTGGNNVCVIASNSNLYCAGFNGDGELGDGTTSNRNTPVKFNLGTKKAKDVAVGGRFICALADDYQVYCAGWNNHGQLGIGNTNSQTTPQRFQLPSGVDAAKVIAGPDAVCVITVYKNLYCAGRNNTGRFGNGSVAANVVTPVAYGQQVSKASVGYNNICTLGSSFGGAVYCAGANNQHQDGPRPWSNSGNISTPQDFYGHPGGYNAQDVALPANYFNTSNNDHACDINAGKVYCWYVSNYGQLGGTTTYDSGSVYDNFSWTGFDLTGTCSTLAPPGMCDQPPYNQPPYNQPPYLTTLSATDVAVAEGYTCALTDYSNGSDTPAVYCAGRNHKGQLGNGTTTDSSSVYPLKPTKFNMPGVATELQLGVHDNANPFTCALNQAGDIYCAGDNTWGQLGDGTTTNRSTPVKFNLAGKTVKQFSSNGYMVCAVASDNQVYCSGAGAYGQLGNGTNSASSTPVKFKLPG